MPHSTVSPATPSQYRNNNLHQQFARPVVDHSIIAPSATSAPEDDIWMGNSVWSDDLQQQLDEAIARTSSAMDYYTMSISPAEKEKKAGISYEESQRRLDEALTSASQEVWARYG